MTEKDNEEKHKRGGFIFNNANALKVIKEIEVIFDKYKLSMMEITHLIKVLNESIDETNKFRTHLTSMEASSLVLGKLMSDKQKQEDL